MLSKSSAANVLYVEHNTHKRYSISFYIITCTIVWFIHPYSLVTINVSVVALPCMCLMKNKLVIVYYLCDLSKFHVNITCQFRDNHYICFTSSQQDAQHYVFPWTSLVIWCSVVTSPLQVTNGLHRNSLFGIYTMRLHEV